MHIRANGGRKGCPGRGAGGGAVPPARRWPVALPGRAAVWSSAFRRSGRARVEIRGTRRLKAELQTGNLTATVGVAAELRPWPVAEWDAGLGHSQPEPPQRVRALPFETEFRTGKTEGGCCGLSSSKSLQESRIEIGVRGSSQNYSSGRESALIFPESSGLSARAKMARVNHPANSVRRVAKWRWLCGLCWSSEGPWPATRQSCQRVSRGSESAETPGGGSENDPPHPGGMPKGQAPAHLRNSVPKVAKLRWNMLGISTLQNKCCVNLGHLIKPNQAKKIMKDGIVKNVTSLKSLNRSLKRGAEAHHSLFTTHHSLRQGPPGGQWRAALPIPHSALRTPHFKRAPLPIPLPAPSSRGEGIRGSREGRPWARAGQRAGRQLLPRPATKERGEGFL